MNSKLIRLGIRIKIVGETISIHDILVVLITESERNIRTTYYKQIKKNIRNENEKKDNDNSMC